MTWDSQKPKLNYRLAFGLWVSLDWGLSFIPAFVVASLQPIPVEWLQKQAWWIKLDMYTCTWCTFCQPNSIFSWEQRIIGIWHSVPESLGYLSQIIYVLVVADWVFFGIPMCCILRHRIDCLPGKPFGMVALATKSPSLHCCYLSDLQDIIIHRITFIDLAQIDQNHGIKC